MRLKSSSVNIIFWIADTTYANVCRACDTAFICRTTDAVSSNATRRNIHPRKIVYSIHLLRFLRGVTTWWL